MIHHPWRIPDELAARYPSHLHIDLLRRLQASGHGSQLTKTLIAALRAQGSRGVHLHVPRGNRRAAGFYRHIGFAELPATDAEFPAPHLHLFGMDLQTTSKGRFPRRNSYAEIRANAARPHTDQKIGDFSWARGSVGRADSG